MERLEASRASIPSNSRHPEDGYRSVCTRMEPPAGKLCQLATLITSTGDQSLLFGLGLVKSLRIPPLLSDIEMCSESEEGQGPAYCNSANMAVSAVVSVCARDDMPTSQNTATEGGFATGPEQTGPPTLRSRNVPFCRLTLVRHRLGQQGFSEAVVNLLVKAARQSTSSTYERAWNGW